MRNRSEDKKIPSLAIWREGDKESERIMVIWRVSESFKHLITSFIYSERLCFCKECSITLRGRIN
jgi:hypothetical protein